jgi:hypothetical protein
VPSPDDFLPSMGGLNGTVAAFAASLAALAAFASCTSGKKTFFFYHSVLRQSVATLSRSLLQTD